MAALKWIRKLYRLAADSGRVLLGGGFRYRKVEVQHPGLLLDQERAAEAVDLVWSTLSHRGYSNLSLDHVLSRIRVRIFANAESHSVRVDLHAAWLGGFRDRGVVLMRQTPDWPVKLEKALIALALLELKQVQPDVPNVTEEADG